MDNSGDYMMDPQGYSSQYSITDEQQETQPQGGNSRPAPQAAMRRPASRPAPTRSIVNLTLLSVVEFLMLVGFLVTLRYSMKSQSEDWRRQHFSVSMFFLAGLLIGAMQLYNESADMVMLRNMSMKLDQIMMNL